jgi:hypothetical protein
MNIAESWAIIEPLIDPKRRPAAGLNLTIKSILRHLAKPRAERDTGESGHSDTGATSSRSERADHRTRDQETGNATREAEAATAEDSSDAAGEDRLDDQTWLECIPIRKTLGVTAIFDEDALLWRHLRPGVDGLIRLIEGRGRDVHKFVAEFSHGLRFPRRVTELLKVSHPRHWIACMRCSGKGRKKGQKLPCSGCDGAGYWVR